ncbi:MAG: hypothetical protein SCH39_04825 [Methanosarcinales archaeon]|nr:hypothetical protein [Methanosarcinales archaeon]
MKLSNRTHLLLWILLIILNFILRIPTTPHEIGYDSVDIHILANSISSFGTAMWWSNPLSVIGMYPLSYASAIPFILSGIFQCSSTDMELVLLIFCIIISLFGTFGAYLLAGMILENDIFRFLVALIFSTSQGVLTLTTWTVSTRGFFIMLLPLFVYSLLKCRSFRFRYSLMTIFFFILLLSTHNLIFFIYPLITSYFLTIIFYEIRTYIHINENTDDIFSIVSFISFFVLLLVPLIFLQELWMNDPEIMRGDITSRYAVVQSVAMTNVRYIGPLIFMIFGGYVSILFKRNKKFNDWFLLFALISLAPLIYVQTYMKWFLIIFIYLLIGISLANVLKINGTYKKYIVRFVLILLIFNISFSGYFQYIHFLNNPTILGRHTDECTFASGMWIKENINQNLFPEHDLVGMRTFAISQKPTLTGDAIGLTYGFYGSINDINITRNSPLTINYYRYGPYIKTPMTPYIQGYINQIRLLDIEHTWSKSIIDKYNLSYVIEDDDFQDDLFFLSVKKSKHNLYDNGNIRLWTLD